MPSSLTDAARRGAIPDRKRYSRIPEVLPIPDLIDGPRDAGPIVGYYCIVNDPDGNLVEFSHGQSLGPGP